MRVIVGGKVRIERPTPEIVKWCKDNLIIGNPEYIKRLRMHFWLGDTPKSLHFYETDGDALILPYGVLRDILPMIASAGISSAEITRTFTERTAVDFGCTVPLYDYQNAAVDATLVSRYGILQSPAGSGKTQMGIALMARLGQKTLWLTHTKDLLSQSRDRAALYMSHALIGTITEGRVDIGVGVTFATVQTMCRLDLAKYRDTWDVIIVDECHRCAGSPTAVTQFSKVLGGLAARHKFGLTATAHRGDGMIRATYALLGRVVYTVPEAAVKDRVMRVGIRVVRTGVGLTRACLNPDGTLNYARLITYLCENEVRNRCIVSQIEAESAHPSLILSDRLGHLRSLMAALPQEMQDRAVMISGKMTSKSGKAEREKAIEDMRAGRKKYLFATFSLAKEGLDIPCLARLYLTTPQKDYAVVTQSVGRIARTFEGKSAPICHDFVDEDFLCADGYFARSYAKRCAIYRKKGCYFVEEAN